MALAAIVLDERQDVILVSDFLLGGGRPDKE
jgi:hypothetical protein